MFADHRADSVGIEQRADASEVRDAVTGRPLRSRAERKECRHCRVIYDVESIEYVRRENDGLCVSCGKPIGSRAETWRSRSTHATMNEPTVTTLATYQSRVGQEVVFEGRCLQVLTSRSGTAFAVMFERGTWSEGFKLVIRTGYVSVVGGRDFIQSLAGKMIRVRGPIIRSPRFGYEITVTTRSMILGVWQ